MNLYDLGTWPSIKNSDHIFFCIKRYSSALSKQDCPNLGKGFSRDRPGANTKRWQIEHRKKCLALMVKFLNATCLNEIKDVLLPKSDPCVNAVWAVRVEITEQLPKCIEELPAFRHQKDKPAFPLSFLPEKS
ncbi:MAG TPA: hypothetical protein VEI01_22200 [Terriglobales bacterium]|nr:hypothetical protein [Terriglobales bacterium]